VVWVLDVGVSVVDKGMTVTDKGGEIRWNGARIYNQLTLALISTQRGWPSPKTTRRTVFSHAC
jgi:hypothetical protein